MCAFASPNIYYALVGGEDFPYTCAPMFGHYIGEGTRFYNFKFIGEFEGGEERPLPPRLADLSEIGTMRFFFSKVYGSCDEISPFGNHPGDTTEKLEERLSRYFKRYLAVLPETERKDLPKLKRLRLEVWRYNSSDEVDAKQIVGSYSISRERFIHAWKKQQDKR